MNAGSFFAELKRRHVYRVAVAYAIVAWLLIQIASILFPTFEAPPWVMKLFVLVIALGLPIALIIAWASVRCRPGSKLTVAVTALALIAAGLLAFRLLQPPAPNSASSSPTAAGLEKSIAVLPFQNLSDLEANAYLVSGIEDGILTRLAKISALKVISRSSTRQYDSKPANIREVAQQLGVANLLQGSMQRVRNVVRINVQLIRAATDEPVWSENYNRKFEDISALEAEIAGAIAEALKAKLTGAEQQALSTLSTENRDAYFAYLRGRDAKSRIFRPEQLMIASQAFAEAVKLDPNFALAWAHGSIVDGLIYFQAFDHSAERLAKARHGAEMAMRFAPESFEAWLAKGYYLWRGMGEYSAALIALEEAGKRAPSNPEVLFACADVERRRGNYAKANELMERSLERDPRNISVMTNLGETLLAMRRPAEARRWFEWARAIDPGDASIPSLKAQSYLIEGNLDAAAESLGPLPRQSTSTATFVIQLEYRQLRHDWPWIVEAIQTVLKSPHFKLNGFVSRLYPGLGWAQRRAGDEAGAQQTFQEGREKLTALRSMLGDNGYITASLAAIEAGLGNCDAALGEAEKSVSAAGEDHFVGAMLVANVATVAALCGRNEKALDTLSRVAREPVSFVHLTKLRWGAEWNSLRADPRFQKLIADAEAAVKAQASK